jgi:hypothetical protein
MNERRPTGLTILAIINFIFAAVDCFNFLTMSFILMAERNVIPIPPDLRKQLFDSLQATVGDMNLVPFVYLSFLESLLSAPLLILSGVGYLKEKRFMGRTLGTTYGVTAILMNILVAVMLQHTKGFLSIGLLIGILYPVLTLIVLNTTFREDLKR